MSFISRGDADTVCIDDYPRGHVFNFVLDGEALAEGWKAASEAPRRVDAAHDKVGLPRAPEKAEDRLTRDTRLGSEWLGYLGVEAIP